MAVGEVIRRVQLIQNKIAVLSLQLASHITLTAALGSYSSLHETRSSS